MKKRFVTDITIEFKHLDTQKFVNHSNIYTYIENTYILFFMSEIKTGWTYSNMPILLKESNTEFFIPITEGAELVAELEIVNVRSKGVEVRVVIKERKSSNICYAIGTRILVYCDLLTAAPIPFEKGLFEKLKSYLSADP